MRAAIHWWDRHQVPLYLLAILVAAGTGLTVPAARTLDVTVTPVLGLLMYATFVGLPLERLWDAFTRWRFLAAVLVLNFMVVPPLVWLLGRAVAADPVVLTGVALVLLCPCIDYVLVFTDLAAGATHRLLAATPVLMLVQLALLPLSMWWVVGPEALAVIDPHPVLRAFLVMIVVPLAAAWLTRRLGRSGRLLAGVAADAMVPLMVLTLFLVVASQLHGVRAHLGALGVAAALYVAFAVIMASLGAAVARGFRLDVPGRRAVIFSAVTRNSLVILPMALALPAAYALAPLVVVTQTLVELVAMVVMVRAVPRFVR